MLQAKTVQTIARNGPITRSHLKFVAQSLDAISSHHEMERRPEQQSTVISPAYSLPESTTLPHEDTSSPEDTAVPNCYTHLADSPRSQSNTPSSPYPAAPACQGWVLDRHRSSSRTLTARTIRPAPLHNRSSNSINRRMEPTDQSQPSAPIDRSTSSRAIKCNWRRAIVAHCIHIYD